MPQQYVLSEVVRLKTLLTDQGVDVFWETDIRGIITEVWIQFVHPETHEVIKHSIEHTLSTDNDATVVSTGILKSINRLKTPVPGFDQ